jgi:hypothetical protein
MSKEEEMIAWYEDAVDRYGEALQNDVATDWEEKYGPNCWEEFHNLDRKIKIKFYVE